MYKYILNTEGSVNWLGIFALVTFFILFCMAIYLAFVKGKKEMDYMAKLPLDDEE